MRRLILLLIILTAGDCVGADEGAVSAGSGPSKAVVEVVESASKAFLEGDLEEARRGFEFVLTLDPDNVTALVNLGAVKFRMQDYDGAELHLNRAVRLNPDAAAGWVTLGILYLERGNLEDALAALMRAVVLDPKDWRAHNYLGVAAGRKGWLYAAEQELGKAIELNPRASEPNFNLALIYLQRSPPVIELARRHYKEALRLGAVTDPLIEKQLEGEP